MTLAGLMGTLLSMAMWEDHGATVVSLNSGEVKDLAGGDHVVNEAASIAARARDALGDDDASRDPLSPS